MHIMMGTCVLLKKYICCTVQVFSFEKFYDYAFFYIQILISSLEEDSLRAGEVTAPNMMMLTHSMARSPVHLHSNFR